MTQLVNPKDVEAQKLDKAQLDLLEPAGDEAVARALAFGAGKYGTRNYIASPIAARIYVAAMRRHITAWLQGEDFAEDSGVHHLGHVAANCHIALAAIEAGTFIDDRHGATGEADAPETEGQEWSDDLDLSHESSPTEGQSFAEEIREADRLLAELGQYPKGEGGRFRSIAERVRALVEEGH
jgi:hypothetical protein